MIEFPWKCRKCGAETMININDLESRPLSKIVMEQGYKCKCGAWEAVSRTSLSLEEAMSKLMRYSPGHPKFEYHFLALVRKATGMMEKQWPEPTP